MNNEDKIENINEKRILILCVDRDGDLKAKAEILTPLLGKEDNLNSAVTLALHDPEEPDANAMFEAVRLYDRLQKEKHPIRYRSSPAPWDAVCPYIRSASY